MLFQEASGIGGLFYLVPWVVFLPVIGLVINLLVGKAVGQRAVGWIASLAVAASFGVSVLLAVALVGHPEAVIIHMLDWITVGSLNVGWNFRVDTLSVTMMLVVSGVGTLIHIYSIGYMIQDVRHNGDPGRFRRFFVYLNLFIAAMMILVSADNYLMLFVGWEGVGLCSYLLIGFWFEKGLDDIGNALAAKKAFVVNRIGDFGLLIALFFIFWYFGSFQFDQVFSQVGVVSPWVLRAVTLLMLVGVTGKSAQIPLYVWLPDAMAGPTPVSALIHAATMVTAGVYLITRSHLLFSADPFTMQVVAWIGAITALFAATIAVGQYDIKKVLAYSTISQLGFMIAAVGMGAYVAGMFHLITHAFFKGLLFLSAGSVILGMERGEEAAYGHETTHGGAQAHGGFDPQDMRNMGGLRGRMRITFWVYVVAALALAGIAPLAGFFSKDEILGAAGQVNPAIFVVLLLAAFLTAFYIWRQISLVFFGTSRTRAAGAASESGPTITIPLIILAILAALGGLINFPGIGSLSAWLEHSLGAVQEAGFNPLLAGIAFLVALSGILVAWFIYGRRPAPRTTAVDPFENQAKPIFEVLAHKWWVDEIYHFLIIRPYQWLAGFTAGWFDQGLVDGIVNDFGSVSRALAQVFRELENGFVRSYALMMLLGVVAILTYLIFWRVP